MAALGYSVLSRGVLQFRQSKPISFKRFNSFSSKLNNTFGLKNFSKRPLKFFFASAPVAALGVGYYYYRSKQNYNPEVAQVTHEHILLAEKPNVPVSRKIQGVSHAPKLQLTLFQYPTCPFCCKVRAFLDYYGLPYDVIEVDPVLRKETKWTTYKKVPILLAKVDGGYQQINDSTMIISALKSYLIHPDQSLEDILDLYPYIDTHRENGKVSSEILNKYFLMYGEDIPKEKSSSVIWEEKNWREWADNSLVHTLSPNVYRTLDEAIQAFTWFSEVGEWDRLFPAWERNLIVYVGAISMYFIGKRLRKRHMLKEDVRESLYDECRTWMKAINQKKTKFMGGDMPNLADLAVYGVLSSIEGCLAFKDLLKRTSIGIWYNSMKEAIKNHEGTQEKILRRMQTAA